MEKILLEMLSNFVSEDLACDENCQRECMLERLKATDESVYKASSAFITAFDAWQQTKADIQLHLKSPDLFKSQKELYYNNLKSVAGDLQVLAAKSDLNLNVYLNALGLEEF